MKKVALILNLILFVTVFSGCADSKVVDGETEAYSTDDEVYEAMTGAAEEGNFKSAVAYYNSGAAGAEKEDTNDWYFYSKAMAEHNEYGCVGRPLDMLQEKVNQGFSAADEKAEELQSLVSEFNNVYESNGAYLYIADGKIAVSIGTQITDFIFCNAEIAVKDDVFYWVDLGADNAHSYSYTITRDGSSLVITPTENNQNDIYSGTYNVIAAEMPMLCY